MADPPLLHMDDIERRDILWLKTSPEGHDWDHVGETKVPAGAMGHPVLVIEKCADDPETLQVCMVRTCFVLKEESR